MPGIVAVIHHLERPLLGNVAPGLERAGVEIVEHDIRHGDPLPDLDTVDGVVSLGGEASATDFEAAPYLAGEAEFMRAAAARDLPLLGVCLGGQLLARALGGSVETMEAPMIGWRPSRVLPAAADDPVVGAHPSGAAVLHWHDDAFELPPGGVELMERRGPGVEAFRHGRSAWGVQFHPDADERVLETWLARAQTERFERAGIDEAELRAESERLRDDQARAGVALFAAFGRFVAARAANRRG